MRAFGMGFVRYAIRHPHRCELLKPWVFGSRRPPELDDRLSGIEETFAGIVREDQRTGALRDTDPEVVALAGQALVYGLSQMIVDGYLPPDRAEELAERVLDTFGVGIANLPPCTDG